ncbi:MAG: hypothetical protein R6U50_00410 [Desulfobacterales bacterium]
MMKSGRFFLVGFALVIAFGMVLGTHGVAVAQDAKLIKLHGVGQDELAGIFIDPETAYIKKDTIVVWLSGVKKQDVKIEFADGKHCKSVTAYNVDFDLDKERWCFVTSWVPFASTSSLQFTDAGRYEYKVVSKDGEVSATGTLVVE